MKIKQLLHSIYSDKFRHTHLQNSAKSERFNIISMTRMKEKEDQHSNDHRKTTEITKSKLEHA